MSLVEPDLPRQTGIRTTLIERHGQLRGGSSAATAAMAGLVPAASTAVVVRSPSLNIDFLDLAVFAHAVRRVTTCCRTTVVLVRATATMLAGWRVSVGTSGASAAATTSVRAVLVA